VSDAGSTSAFQQIVRDLDYPMLVVTAAAGGEVAGCLVGFGTQCSIRPARFAVWLSKKNHTCRVARSADALAVHVLAADEREVAERFGARTGDHEDTFAGSAWHPGPFGAPLLDDVGRWFVGRVIETNDSGDHVLFLLDVLSAHTATSPWPGQLGYQAVKDIEPGHLP
jgi:flavin reductase (DIM6/NTAB) family NADH-FMN oxidoreductase RutF